MNSLVLAARQLRRDWRAGELHLLGLALVVAVASTTSVGFFTDRVQQALRLQATVLLGGDLLLSSSREAAPQVRQMARAAGLSMASAVEFPSMVIAGERSQLASVAALSAHYPLRGSLRIASRLFGSSRKAEGVPAPGTVWLEPRLLQALQLRVGDMLQLGATRFRVAAVLLAEPARVSGTLFSIAPRLLLSRQDLQATGLILPGSRLRYRLLFSGRPAQLARFSATVGALLSPGERLIGVENARPEIRSALQRAQRFLGLAALISVLLAGIAIAMATRRFITRHLDACALMRCFGATAREIIWLHLLELLLLALLAVLLGCAAGYLLQFGLVHLLGTLLGLQLPSASLLPVLVGTLTALVSLLGFALPPLLHLRRVTALRVLRRELGALTAGTLSTYSAGLVAFAGLVLWQAADWRLGGYVIAGSVFSLLLLVAVARLVIRLLRILHPRLRSRLRFGLLGLVRRPAGSSLQVAALGLGMTVLLLLAVVRGDLLDAWQQRLPPEAPNHFLINIQPDQVSAVGHFLRAQGREAPAFFPVVRGRLLAINDHRITPESYQDEAARRLMARVFNLSWSAVLPADNKIVSGQWWGAANHPRALLSVERGLARTLGIHLGDTLHFRVAGRALQARVASLRSVDWESMRVNFYVLASPGVLASFPVSYISSIYVPDDQTMALSALVRAFPNITVIDVAAVMKQVRQVIDRVSLAVQYVFLFSLVAGLLVLYATIQSTLDERIRETAIMRMLGASRRQLVQGLVVEFTTIGLLAGLIAAAAATALGKLLAARVFHLAYVMDYHLLLAGVLAGMLGIGISGYLGTRRVLQCPPWQTLMARI